MYKQQAAFKQTCYYTLIENIQAHKKQRIFTTLKTNICPNVFKQIEIIAIIRVCTFQISTKSESLNAREQLTKLRNK